MALERLTKQPSESRLFDFDFGGKMATGETVTAVVSVVSTPSGLTVGATSFSGMIAQVRLSAGTDQVEYLLTCKVTTSAANTLELDGLLFVAEITSQTALKQAASDALNILCPFDSDPPLNSDDVNSLLNNAVRAVVWTAVTTYVFGVTVMPMVRNGRRYRLIAFDGSGVKSGATEPTWPAPTSLSTSFPVWGQVQPNPVTGWWRNAIVADGNITWQEDGVDYDSLWDVQRAAFNGWMLKAGRAVCAIDIKTGQKGLAQSQIYEHCISQAQRYAPVYVI